MAPTAGGGSWLAHATLLSGLWIDTEQRHRALLAGERLTLGRAFHRAGWRTVGVMPAPVVTGPAAGRGVPVTVVARDPAVLDRIARWGWRDGLRPGPDAPVWRMDHFRDRFLTAFGSTPGPAGSPSSGGAPRR